MSGQGQGGRRRYWTDAERDELRRLYPSATATVVAGHLGRTARAVYLEAKKLGLATQGRAVVDAAFLASVAKLNAAGLSDTEAAAELRCERRTLARHRKALGLPSNARGDRYKARVRANAARQCEAAGVPSLAWVRARAFARAAAEAGWPSDLPPRAVRILDALAERGPQTRRELCEAVGMPWIGSRASLRCRGPGGSYLAVLMARGLVVSLGRAVRGEGRGRSVQLYSLGMFTERGWGDGGQAG